MDIQWRTTDMTFSDDTLASKGLEIKKNSQLNRQKKKVAEICSINWILSDSLPWIFLLVLKLTRMSHETPAAAACKHHIPHLHQSSKKTKKTNLTALTHFPKIITTWTGITRHQFYILHRWTSTEIYSVIHVIEQRFPPRRRRRSGLEKNLQSCVC